MKADNGRQHIALPNKEMRVMMVILLETNPDGVPTVQLAKKAGIIRNEKCVHVVTQRLRRRGLLRTVYRRERGEGDRLYTFAYHQLTPDGLTLALAWWEFLRKLGPRLGARIGWEQGGRKARAVRA